MPDEDFSYFDLDIFRLEEEWIRQVSIFREHSRKLADADDTVRRAEAEVKVRKAEMDKVVAKLDLQIRQDPTTVGLVKATPAEAVSNAILLQDDFIASQDHYFDGIRKLNKAKHVADIAKVDVDTLRQKKDAIQDMVILQGREYFATPNLPHILVDKRKMTDAAMDRAFGKKKERS